MTKRVTSFAAQQTSAGMRVAFTYSIIDDAGNVTKDNAKASVIVLDDKTLNSIDQINSFLFGKIPE